MRNGTRPRARPVGSDYGEGGVPLTLQVLCPTMVAAQTSVAPTAFQLIGFCESNERLEFGIVSETGPCVTTVPTPA